MARAKRSALQRERDLAWTEELHLRGQTTVEIAEELKRRTGIDISPRQVVYDIGVLRKTYRKAGVRDYSVDLNYSLRKIDMLEKRAWALLEQSGSERKITSRKTRRKGEDSTMSEVGDRTEQRDPDARYMVVIQWCIAERNKLLGLYPPDELKHSGNIGAIREIIYELPQQQAAPGLTVIGGLPTGAHEPEPVAQLAPEEERLVEIWGGADEIVVAPNGVH